MKVKVIFWFVRGDTEAGDRIYADRPEEVERYLKANGIRILHRTERLLDPYAEEKEEFTLVYPFRYRLKVWKRGFLIFQYGFRGFEAVPGKEYLEIYLPKTGGLQVYELVSEYLIGGIAW